MIDDDDDDDGDHHHADDGDHDDRDDDDADGDGDGDRDSTLHDTTSLSIIQVPMAGLSNGLLVCRPHPPQNLAESSRVLVGCRPPYLTAL